MVLYFDSSVDHILISNETPISCAHTKPAEFDLCGGGRHGSRQLDGGAARVTSFHVLLSIFALASHRAVTSCASAKLE